MDWGPSAVAQTLVAFGVGEPQVAIQLSEHNRPMCLTWVNKKQLKAWCMNLTVVTITYCKNMPAYPSSFWNPGHQARIFHSNIWNVLGWACQFWPSPGSTSWWNWQAVLCIHKHHELLQEWLGASPVRQSSEENKKQFCKSKINKSLWLIDQMQNYSNIS